MDKTTTYSEYPILRSFSVDDIQFGTKMCFWMELVTDGLGTPVCIPVMVAKGISEGPTLGFTAAIHGNEINGIPVIHRLFAEIDEKALRGTVIGVPVANAISFILEQRRFNDGKDLNHIMPGKADGDVSQVYAYRLVERLVKKFDYLVDLHTASFGRINSYYIRADMSNPIIARMALLQNADIIVHNPPSDGTLRGAADDLGIHAITLELGDPNKFQRQIIRSSYTGAINLMADLNMIDEDTVIEDPHPIMCSSSIWMYTDAGGLLRVIPEVTDMVKQGETVANLYNLFGEVIASYKAPFDGVVIGRETNPVTQTGGRILHLGKPE